MTVTTKRYQVVTLKIRYHLTSVGIKKASKILLEMIGNYLWNYVISENKDLRGRKYLTGIRKTILTIEEAIWFGKKVT